MKKIITSLALMFCICATAQNNTEIEYMFVHRSNNAVDSIPVSEIDSIVFVTPPVVETPDNPTVAEAVDLGLSVKWASCNVGASSPEERGNYYAWGEVEPKDNYTWETYKWCDGTGDSMLKYCTNGEYSYNVIDNKTVLDLEDDAAHVNMGGNWRMPTYDEFNELRKNCTIISTTYKGVKGYKVVGPNGNSIFLPKVSRKYGTDITESATSYWTSELDDDRSNAAYTFNPIDTNDTPTRWYWLASISRVCGYPVRAVCE